MKIAVLLATFNRKEKTLTCLERLSAQLVPPGLSIEVFLTDDNSTDGTRDAVKTRYPEVNIFKGSGSLFWAGGMRNSWSMAIASGPDYYLLLNDDTVLREDCIGSLLKYYQLPIAGCADITVGSTIDAETKELSYGGHKLYNKGSVKHYIVSSETEYLECDLANANIMMVPRETVKRIGILSSEFTHSIADFDYTLRAGKAGMKVIVVPGILGDCTDDNLAVAKQQPPGLHQRIKHLKSPKGLAYKEYMGFIRTHFPKHVPLVFTKIWLKTL
ncbi:MAG: glycosyltransferase family 2 protein, partial [Phormidesmis sp. FL-bin-119]|nr:glycosyltransferase family 2 protein [Pedobacter sp.]